MCVVYRAPFAYAVSLLCWLSPRGFDKETSFPTCLRKSPKGPGLQRKRVPGHMGIVRWWPEHPATVDWLRSYLPAQSSGSYINLSSQQLAVNIERHTFVAPLAL